MNKENDLYILSKKIHEVQNKKNEIDAELIAFKQAYNEALLKELGATEKDPLSSCTGNYGFC